MKIIWGLYLLNTCFTLEQKMKRNHLVLTTINYPSLLREYLNNLLSHGTSETTKIWIVGDKKTPDLNELASEISYSGLETVYLDIEKQDEWGKRFADFYNRIPYNNETRRNIGYLHALEEGCERLICIDDDNWSTTDDFIQGHELTGQEWNQCLLTDKLGFFNICEYLEIEPSRSIFPRGYPFALRGTKNNPEEKLRNSPVTIGATAGLWLREPDIDAITWLNGKVESVAYNGPDVFVLSQDTWSPINTQNTSVIRELIPAFLCIPMGWEVPGGKIQRYGDIWGGYFLQAVMKGTNYHVAFGRPIVDHRRNPHDYLDDLRQEFWGMILTDWLTKLLRESFKPTDSDVCDRVDHLADFIMSEGINKLPNWCTNEVRSFIEYTAGNLRTWSQACRQVR